MRMEEFLPSFMVGWAINSDKFKLEHPLDERHAQLDFDLSAVADETRRTITMPDHDVDLGDLGGGPWDESGFTSLSAQTLAGWSVNADFPDVIFPGAGIAFLANQLIVDPSNIDGQDHYHRAAVEQESISPVPLTAEPFNKVLTIPLSKWPASAQPRKKVRLRADGTGGSSGVSSDNDLFIRFKVQAPGGAVIEYGLLITIWDNSGQHTWSCDVELEIWEDSNLLKIDGLVTTYVKNALDDVVVTRMKNTFADLGARTSGNVEFSISADTADANNTDTTVVLRGFELGLYEAFLTTVI